MATKKPKSKPLPIPSPVQDVRLSGTLTLNVNVNMIPVNTDAQIAERIRAIAATLGVETDKVEAAIAASSTP